MMTLLVAEDDPDVREAVLESLSFLPIKIHCAVNGAEALEIVKKHEITAILSDIKMPQMTGIELLQSVRLMGLDTPFVFLTGFSDQENILNALRAGAFDFLEKPFQKDYLCKVVEMALLIGQKIQSLEKEFVTPDIPNLHKRNEVQRYIKARKEIDLMKFESELRLRKRA